MRIIQVNDLTYEQSDLKSAKTRCGRFIVVALLIIRMVILFFAISVHTYIVQMGHYDDAFQSSTLRPETLSLAKSYRTHKHRKRDTIIVPKALYLDGCRCRHCRCYCLVKLSCGTAHFQCCEWQPIHSAQEIYMGIVSILTYFFIETKFWYAQA